MCPMLIDTETILVSQPVVKASGPVLFDPVVAGREHRTPKRQRREGVFGATRG